MSNALHGQVEVSDERMRGRREFWIEFGIAAVGFAPVVMALWVLFSVLRDGESAQDRFGGQQF
jgi:hypothetical protein